VKNLTDIQSGGAARAEQNAWLKTIGVDVEAIQSAARASSTPPTLDVNAGPAQVASPSPALGNYTVDVSARPDLGLPDSARTSQRTPTHYKEHEEPVAEAAKPAQATPTHYQEFREPEAADDAQPAFPGASHYSAPLVDLTKKSSDLPDDDSDDENGSENGPYGQATEASGDEARAADASAVGGADDQEIEPQTPVETGMKTKRVDAKYEGEHNKAGWRKEIWKVDAEDTRITTKLYSKEEQAANRLVQKAGGKFKMGDGQATDNLKKGFAMDETGRMVAFKEDEKEKITSDPYDGEERREETTAHPTAVVRSDPNARVEVTHHSTALGGESVYDEDGKPVRDAESRRIMRSKPAALAGIVEFNNEGQIKNITNQSGHYKPTVDYLLQGVEYLMKQGAFFEDEVVRMTDNVAEGEKYKPLKDSDPDYKLYKNVQAKLADGKKLAARIRALSEALDKEEDEKKAAEIGGQLEKLKGELDTLKALVDKSQEDLRKKGVGPANRLRRDARAEFLDVKPDMTGSEVHAAQTTIQHVGDFLATGGDYQKKGDKKTQAERKEVALKDLKSDPAPRRFAPTGSLEEQKARKEAALKKFRGPGGGKK